MNYIKKFKEITLADISSVGGKNASLGQMISRLASKGITVPDGFAITAQAYWYFVQHNNLLPAMHAALDSLTDSTSQSQLQFAGSTLRSLFEKGSLPDDLAREIKNAYDELSACYGLKAADVAVRSSATAEDLPGASFAGQQETFLNIVGHEQLLLSCKKSMGSLFTDRALAYRSAKGFDNFSVALSVGVQKMVRSDKACAGVAFSLDTETGFKEVITINASYGLGEMLVQGEIIPDEYVVHKPTLLQGYSSIIKKVCGSKEVQLVYTNDQKKPVQSVAVSADQQQQFCLTDQEIIALAHMVYVIEQDYSQVNNAWVPIDVEWAKDGSDGVLYIVQARPETVHGFKKKAAQGKQFSLNAPLDEQKKIVCTGQSIGQAIVTGTARIVQNMHDSARIQEGDIIVTTMTNPDWMPVIKRVAAIITDYGGRTCHAAIVSRELGLTALVGTHRGTSLITDGQMITVDCSQGATGYVYDGKLSFNVHTFNLDKVSRLSADIMVNIADPDRAFALSFLPVQGVGLARLEFIINNVIKIHPMALLQPEKIADTALQKTIAKVTAAYPSGKDFFVSSLAQGIGMIAAAFYPKKVVVRLSDFKTNEYKNLLGGNYFELEEENPMLGFRGASRYYHEQYAPAFALECAALKKVRDQMGLSNVAIMVPFVRTVQEAEKVVALMKEHGLIRGENGLQFIMMVEIPSNVLLIQKFSSFFDAFSLGSNDLTQLTLGVDRDSALLSSLFDERDEAVKIMMKMALDGAHAQQKPIGICGQAPSDYPEIADFLLNAGINSLSLNHDAVVPFLMRYKK